MTPAEFEQAAIQLVAWLAEYRRSLEDQPVMARVSPGDVRRALPPEPPSVPETLDAILEDLESIVVPGMTHVQHPMHFGWFPSNASLASVLGDLASSGLGGLGISWESNPALTEVEEVMCDWMRQLVGLSDAWRGTIHDTASVSTLVAMITARERASDFSFSHGGLQAVDAPLIVYTTHHAHSSVMKAALLAGFGANNVRRVDEDASFAMRPDALTGCIEADVAAGKKPAIVVTTVGTTGTTAVDPIEPIVHTAQRHGVWVHVDAALAGTAMLLPEQRHLWQGIEGADSLSWNPHKWMGTILDTSLFYVRDPHLLNQVMSTNPSYLRSVIDEGGTQFRDWGLPLGRRFRALKLWFHLRLDGIEAIRSRIRRDLDNADWLRTQIESAAEWEIVAPTPLQTVCVIHRPNGLQESDLDDHTLRWVRAINQSGEAYLTPSLLDGRWTVRVSVGVEGTERHHVAALWELMQRFAAQSARGVNDT